MTLIGGLFSVMYWLIMTTLIGAICLKTTPLRLLSIANMLPRLAVRKWWLQMVMDLSWRRNQVSWKLSKSLSMILILLGGYALVPSQLLEMSLDILGPYRKSMVFWTVLLRLELQRFSYLYPQESNMICQASFHI